MTKVGNYPGRFELEKSAQRKLVLIEQKNVGDHLHEASFLNSSLTIRYQTRLRKLLSYLGDDGQLLDLLDAFSAKQIYENLYLKSL